MRFLDECINDSLPIWQECFDSEFIQGMINGSLNEECFKGYIIEDSLYLREYAKVFAWGIVNARTMAEINNYYDMLAFVNEGEGSTRKYYLKRYGLTDEQIEELPLRAENKAYVETMIKAAKSGGVVECLMATLPCMISYRWLFEKVAKDYPQVKDGVYGKFISDYESKEYAAVCDKWIEFAERMCQKLSDEEKAQSLKIFRTCSEHELRFWKMSAKPRIE